ncbi:hypothetical protein EU78_27920 [Mycolicibacterium rufum]|nr:hypothetical protein EU78_27920 [Mycolicibacterium rufum]
MAVRLVASLAVSPTRGPTSPTRPRPDAGDDRCASRWMRRTSCCEGSRTPAASAPGIRRPSRIATMRCGSCARTRDC